MKDKYGRKIDYLRISVTDRCNLRCVYCMPPEGVKSIPHSEILSYEEIIRVVAAAAKTGISKIKITGGEPLIRKDVVSLIRQIKEIRGISQVTLTTNGLLFGFYARQLMEAGLDGVNFSLDSLDADSYEKITGTDAFESALKSVKTALQLGIKTKINCVPIRGYNNDSLLELAGMARQYKLDVRFIELMPLGMGSGFEPISNSEVKSRLICAFGQPIPNGERHGNGPAEYFDFPGFLGSVGFVSAMYDGFCPQCNRLRLTSDGHLKTCLCSNNEVALKPLLRGGHSDADLENAIAAAIACKPERHRLNQPDDGTMETKKMFQIGG